MDEVPTVDGLVRFVCAFCNGGTEDDPQYALIDVRWAFSGAAQSLGAHAACLRSSVHKSIPLAVD